MYLRGSSCPSCFPEKHSTSVPRLHPSRACRALCFLFSVAVEGLARCACTLCSLGRASAPSPAGAWGSAPHPNQLISQSAGRQRRPFGLIAAKGGGPGFNLCGSSKPPNLQTSKLPLQRKTRPDNVRGGVGLCVCVGECQNSTYYTTSASQNASTFFNFLSRPRKRPRANRLGASVWRDRRNEDEQLTLMLTSIE